MFRYCLVVATALTAHATFAGQQSSSAAASSAVQLEVASVARNTARGRGMMGPQPDGRFVATNATLRQLIGEAYGVEDFQIVGGPAWASFERFDVVVKARPSTVQKTPGAPPPTQQMLRALLAQEFTLELRKETREMPAFELKLRNADKKPGRGLVRSTMDCSAAGRGEKPPAPGGAGERPRCGARMGLGTLTAGGIPPAQLAAALSRLTGRPVVDRTGLSGGFDIDLAWTPDQFKRGLAPANAPPLPPGIDPNGPSIYEAIRDQLGLKLDFAKVPVQVLLLQGASSPVK